MPSLTVAPVAPARPSGDNVEIPPGLLNGVGVVGLLVVSWWLLATGRIVTRREADDLRSQRDKANDRAERMDDINAVQSEAIREFARKEDLGVRSLEAIRERAEEKSGDA